MTGEQLKTKIRKAGLTLDAAAAFLGISRQTLYINLNKAKLPIGFMKTVEEKLSPHLETQNQEESSVVNDSGGIYGSVEADLRKTIKVLESMVAMQDSIIKRLELDLEQIRMEGKSGARRHSA